MVLPKPVCHVSRVLSGHVFVLDDVVEQQGLQICIFNDLNFFAVSNY